MPLTEVPNSPPPPVDEDGLNAGPATRAGAALPPRRGTYGDLGTDELVQRINDLEDERRAARIREGIWIALLLHAAVLLLWVFGPRYLLHQPHAVSITDAFKDHKNLTYLNLPPDLPKDLPKAKAPASKTPAPVHPSIDRKTLEHLQAQRPAAPPAPQPQQQQTPLPPSMPQQPVPQQPPPQQAQTQPPPPTATPSPVQPELKPQPQSAPSSQQPSTNPFKTPSSAGDMIRQATRGASGGSSGDSGGQAFHGGMGAGAEILSDTLGVDFGPYMKRVVAATYSSWLPIIPESARPPLNNKGKVYIDFIIAPDGSVKKMLLRGPSGDVSLDRAAWGGITGASYPPLPKEFKGPYLALRFGFYYNIKPEDDK